MFRLSLFWFMDFFFSLIAAGAAEIYDRDRFGKKPTMNEDDQKISCRSFEGPMKYLCRKFMPTYRTRRIFTGGAQHRNSLVIEAKLFMPIFVRHLAMDFSHKINFPFHERTSVTSVPNPNHGQRFQEVTIRRKITSTK